MLFSIEQALVGWDEIRARLKRPAWETSQLLAKSPRKLTRPRSYSFLKWRIYTVRLILFIYTIVLFCQNGARIVKSPVRGEVASTEKGGSNSWIDLGNFTGKMSAAKSWVTHKVEGQLVCFLEFFLLTRFWHVAEVSFSLYCIISFYSNRKSITSIFIYLFIFIFWMHQRISEHTSSNRSWGTWRNMGLRNKRSRTIFRTSKTGEINSNVLFTRYLLCKNSNHHWKCNRTRFVLSFSIKKST